MSRPVHPVAVRLPRDERARVYALAHTQGQTVSGLVKGLVRAYLATQPVMPAPDVHMAVNRGLSDPPMLPALLAPHRLPRQTGMRATAALRRGAGEQKGCLSDTAR